MHDYNIGVSFTMNKNLKNCSINPIPFNSFDEDGAFTQAQFEQDGSVIVKLKSPESFLSLDSDYIYTGRRYVNNIPSEIYISDRFSKSNKTYISEYAFSSVSLS